MRVEDLFARADPEDRRRSGFEANVRNAGQTPARGQLEFAVAPAAAAKRCRRTWSGASFRRATRSVATELKLDTAAALGVERSISVSRHGAPDARPSPAAWTNTRCAAVFASFGFENGYFRLNGRRLFLRSTHTCNHFPVGLKLPPDPDMARRDLLDVKAMGFNMIRFIWGGAERYQLDLCDEIGLMVYEESFASWPMQDSPQIGRRGGSKPSRN